MPYLVGLTTESKSWCNTWSNIPFNVSARVVDQDTLAPAREVIVRLESTDSTSTWVGGTSNIIELETNYDGEIFAELKFGKTPPQGVTITATKIDTDPADVKPAVREILMVASTLHSHSFPIASGANNTITEADVAAGVYAVLPLDTPVAGDVVSFHFSDNPVIKHSEHNEGDKNLAVSVPDDFMTTGAHDTGYYITESSNNSTFSPVITVNVKRDSASSTIVDLPPVTVPRADANEGMINIAVATFGVEVCLSGTYKNLAVHKAGVTNSICNIYWKSYVGKKEIPEASSVFSFPVNAEADEKDIIVLDDSYEGGTDALRKLLYVLGEGTVKISYEMLIADGGKLHASAEQTYYVDVVAPGRK
ncbi:hypothetical protein ACE38U_16685 [Cedecea sp. S5-13]|uniref:hypothetical protein n=1 Tax=Cedecea selenatireducens TaxID=3144416 RepID=UPI0035CCF1F1